MSRRGRAAAFAIVALGCAVVAALVADSYGTSVASQYGELRPVVVAARDLPDGELLDARDAGRLLEIRRVPASFVPPGALMAAGDAIGRATAAPLPAGSYLLDLAAARCRGNAAAETSPRSPTACARSRSPSPAPRR